MSVGIPPDVSGSSHSFVSARIGDAGSWQRRGLRADRPVLEVELAHRKVLRVPGCKWNGARYRRCGDQAVCLCESDSPRRVLTSPPAGKLACTATDLDDLQPIEQSIRRGPLIDPEPSMDLLDVDRGGARDARVLPQRSQPFNRAGPTAEHVDEDRCIQENWHVQPRRRGSPARWARTHPSGSTSHSCSLSRNRPTAPSMSFQRRSSSNAPRTAEAMKALR